MSLTSYQAAPPCNKGRCISVHGFATVNGFLFTRLVDFEGPLGRAWRSEVGVPLYAPRQRPGGALLRFQVGPLLPGGAGAESHWHGGDQRLRSPSRRSLTPCSPLQISGACAAMPPFGWGRGARCWHEENGRARLGARRMWCSIRLRTTDSSWVCREPWSPPRSKPV